jgi:four helix bundle protein
MPNALAHPVAGSPAALDLDRLDAYRVSLEFQAVASAVLAGVRGELRSQLDRASLSVVLNVAEGFGRRDGAGRRHFYSIARGSALECAAILDVMAGRAGIKLDDLRRGRALLVRITAMLTKLGQC